MQKVNNAVLASLEICGWSANKRDETASREVAQNHGLKDEKMARVWKSLLPRNDKLEAVLRIERRAREFHYDNTLPWKHKGPRILPTANYLSYTEGVREARAGLEKAVSEFLSQFATLKCEARLLLGSMYEDADYPSESKLGQSFVINLSIDPLPVSESMLQLGMAPDEIERLKAQHEEEMAETFRRANEDLWSRLYEAIRSFHAQVIDPARSVRDTTFENLRKLLPILERLNVTGDERLERMRARMEKALHGVTTQALKEDLAARLRTAREADAVFDAMSAFMGMPSEGPQLEVRHAA